MSLLVLNRWFDLACGCHATNGSAAADGALIIVESCRAHRMFVPADGLFLDGEYGPIDVAWAAGA